MAQIRSLSVELGIGVMNGECLRPYPEFEGCHNCEATIFEHKALPGLATNIGASISIYKRSSISIGCLINEVRFEQTQIRAGESSGVLHEFLAYKLDYISWFFSYSYRILRGKKMELAWNVGAMYEHLLKAREGKSIVTNFKENNLSYFMKVEFRLIADKRNKIIVSPIAILPFNNYHRSDYINTNYRPLRYGIIIGLRSQLMGRSNSL